jgi:hypothetical protein
MDSELKAVVLIVASSDRAEQFYQARGAKR